MLMKNLIKSIKNKFILIPIFTFILSLIFLIFINYKNNSMDYKSYTLFQKDLLDKRISTVYITDNPKIRIKLKDGSVYETDNPRTPDIKQTLLEKNILDASFCYINYIYGD